MKAIDPFETIAFHSKGKDDWSFWRRARIGFMILTGARLYYHLCGAVRPKVGMNGDFLGLDLLPVSGRIIISHGIPHASDIENISPVTHLIAVDEEKENGR